MHIIQYYTVYISTISHTVSLRFLSPPTQKVTNCFYHPLPVCNHNSSELSQNIYTRSTCSASSSDSVSFSFSAILMEFLRLGYTKAAKPNNALQFYPQRMKTQRVEARGATRKSYQFAWTTERGRASLFLGFVVERL